MKDSIRWGIIGLGNIAHQFVQDLLLVDDAIVQAVAARNANKAKEFAKTYGKEITAYGSYQEVFNDPDVDIVYIATPHSSHAALSIQALDSGKAVLCEKPVALNHAQAKAMVEASRRNKRFFMEAFWTRFNPSFQALLARVQAGEIGDIRYIQADFSFRVDVTEADRMLNPKLGGGSLLEMGVYPVFLAYIMLGKPDRIQASAIKHACGADLQTAMIFDYAEAQALLYSSYTSQSNMIATVSGTKGRLLLNPTWHETHSFSYFKNYDATEIKLRKPPTGKGFYHEILECHACLKQQRIESTLWSHTHCLELIQIVDDVRSHIGLRFPDE